MTVNITNFKVLNSGVLKASFTASFADGFELRENKLFQQNDKEWINAPHREYIDGEGKRSFFPLVVLPLAMKQEILDAALVAYTQAQAQKNNEPTSISSSVGQSGDLVS